ncbi:MAG TPA: SlyX family protein [Rhodanobacteraceae bacterium]|nr:SlyX family protein [Rhodanobacteraceae bacterium]
MNELELKLTFLDDAVASLNDGEAQQTRRLLQLENALAELRRELASLRTSLVDNVNDEPPPHY